MSHSRLKNLKIIIMKHLLNSLIIYLLNVKANMISHFCYNKIVSLLSF